MDKKYSRETLCVQAGWTPKKGEPRVLPIYQSTTFKVLFGFYRVSLLTLAYVTERSKKKNIFFLEIPLKYSLIVISEKQETVYKRFCIRCMYS